MENTRRSIRLRPAFVVLALGCFSVFLLGPLVIAVLVLAFAPLKVSVWVALGLVGFVAIMAYAMSSSYQWIELDGGIIRGRRLLTRRMFEMPVADIVRVTPLNSAAMGALENMILDSMMKTSNRGYELGFRDGSKLGLVRGDMIGLDEFLEALAEEIVARCPHLKPP